MSTQRIVFITPFPNDNWTRVEIFYVLMDDYQMKKVILLTKTLDLFCKNYEAGLLKTATVNLDAVYKAIKNGKVILSKDL